MGFVSLQKSGSPPGIQLFEHGRGPIELANRFLKAIETRGLASSSIRTYGYALVSVFRWLGDSGKELESLLQADLLGFVSWSREAGARPSTINQHLTACRIFYRFCFDQEIPRGNGGMSFPSAHYAGRGRDRYLGIHARRPQKSLQLRVKTPRKLIQPLTPEDVKTFIRHLPRYRDLTLVLAMLLCGLRSCEVLALELRDVDLAERRMIVRGKGNKERALPIPAELLAAMKKYLHRERPVQAESERVFVILQGKRRGKPMTSSGIRSLFRHRRLFHGLERANPHRFRHTFGADMAREGVNLPVLQRMMGHVSGTTTLQYIQLSMADIAGAYRLAMESIEKRYEEK